jgi:hypothetical protein
MGVDQQQPSVGEVFGAGRINSHGAGFYVALLRAGSRIRPVIQPIYRPRASEWATMLPCP